VTLLALLRRDVLSLLWRPRSLLVLAYLAAGAWAAMSVPEVEQGSGVRPIGVALTDAIPHAFRDGWSLIAVQALPLVVLVTALIVEDRQSGGTWMTVHRAGGKRAWWTAKAVAAVTLAVAIVAASAVLILAAGLARGWHPTLAVSEYGRAGTDIGYDRIGDTSPLAGSAIVVVLRMAVLAAIALFALALALVTRRPTIAYALPIILLVLYWRVTARALPVSFTNRGDLLGQAFWDQHGPGYNVSWWWTPPVVVAWTLAALALGRVVATRAEVTDS
jgi:hypothetical protein